MALMASLFLFSTWILNYDQETLRVMPLRIGMGSSRVPLRVHSVLIGFVGILHPFPLGLSYNRHMTYNQESIWLNHNKPNLARRVNFVVFSLHADYIIAWANYDQAMTALPIAISARSHKASELARGRFIAKVGGRKKTMSQALVSLLQRIACLQMWLDGTPRRRNCRK